MAAYWIVRVNVIDGDKLAAYAPLAAEAVSVHGGRYLARGGEAVSVEGAHYARNVIVEWPNYKTATQAYQSDEYQRALAALDGGADRLFVITEGL